MLIGITGQIGSGKSTAAKILKQMGMAVIDADKIGKRVVDKTPALLKKLVKQFSSVILTKSGNLRRKKLAELAFENEKSKKKLNALVHPYLLKELTSQIKQKSKKSEYVVVDAALLLDWRLDKKMDITIVIHASLKDRLKRLNDRGISQKDALSRQKAQLPFSEYRKRADIMILNNQTECELKKKLKKIITK
ncbi:MAG: dephospho-CoA kinase [candidate division Zixibacteria bacterium]|nr:dephospho-CoA kinase [candidate division Zixibacteria bacterium]